jgi:hypothetical protein
VYAGRALLPDDSSNDKHFEHTQLFLVYLTPEYRMDPILCRYSSDSLR